MKTAISLPDELFHDAQDTRRVQPLFGAAKDSILYLAPDEELLTTGVEWSAVAADPLSPP
jgi:hypothetical protein